MLSTTREASNSRSLNGIISIEDGNGTIIEDGVIKANSIEISQQMQIDGDLVCENLVASGHVECLDVEASGDITCDNIIITSDLTSADANIGNLNSNFVVAGEIAVGSILNVEDEINLKLDTTTFESEVVTLNQAIDLKLDTTTFESTVVTLNQAIDLKLDTTTFESTVTTLNQAIDLKTDSSTFESTVTTLNDAILTKLDTTTFESTVTTTNEALDTKANKSGGENFISSKDPSSDSFSFSDFSARTGGALVEIRGTASKIALGVYTGVMSLGNLTNVESSINTALSRVTQTFTGTDTIFNSTATTINSTTTSINGVVNIGNAGADKNLNVYGDLVMVNVNSLAGRSQLIFNEGGTNNARISHTTASSTNVTSRCLNFEILTAQLTEGFRFCSSAVQLFRIDAQGNTNTKGHQVFNASGSNASAILANGQTTTYCTNTQIQFRYKTTTGSVKTKTFTWD